MTGRRTLLRGGIVLTGDDALGVVWPGDVLIEDDRIAAVAPRLDAGDAEVIDVSGRIVLPGFVDTHRHTWQSIVRNIASDWTLTQYLVGLHSGLSKHFRQQDTYIGNYLGALEALDSGSRRCSTGRTTCSRPSTPTRPSRRCGTRACGPPSPRAAERSSGARRSRRPIRIRKMPVGSGCNTATRTTGW